MNLVPYSQSAYLRLDYTASRKRYVLESIADQPWKLMATEIISTLPRYRDTDTVEAYSEYLRRFPDDPPEDLEFARTRIRYLGEEREKREKRSATLAKLEDTLRTKPHGNDIGQVYQAMKARSHVEAKGEFETTQSHRERVAAARTRTLPGGLAVDAPLIFEVQKDATYDADTQQLKIVLKFSSVWDGRDLDKAAESLRSRSSENRSSYVATNGFGAVVDVTRSFDQSYELAVRNVASLPTRMDERRVLTTTLSVRPEDAKRVKEGLRVFAIGRVVAPFASEGHYYIEPKFDSPRELLTEFYYVHVEVIGLWLYDPATHRILARIDA